jgi:hypothetical protein
MIFLPGFPTMSPMNNTFKAYPPFQFAKPFIYK